jgi:hypothetical protein
MGNRRQAIGEWRSRRTVHERLVAKIKTSTLAPVPADTRYPFSKTRSGKATDRGIAKNLNADKSIHCDLIQLTTAVSVQTTFIAVRSASESTLAFGDPVCP